jgi:hypothetical protein
MIGTFNYRKNCSIPHHIPSGETRDGYPVIVFPKNIHDVTIGKTYDFVLSMTREATYTIDNEIYRVGHAIALMEHEGTEGGIIDIMLHSPRQGNATKLGECLGEDTAEKLAALRARLSAG